MVSNPCASLKENTIAEYLTPLIVKEIGDCYSGLSILIDEATYLTSIESDDIRGTITEFAHRSPNLIKAELTRKISDFERGGRKESIEMCNEVHKQVEAAVRKPMIKALWRAIVFVPHDMANEDHSLPWDEILAVFYDADTIRQQYLSEIWKFIKRTNYHQDIVFHPEESVEFYKELDRIRDADRTQLDQEVKSLDARKKHGYQSFKIKLDRAIEALYAKLIKVLLFN